MAHKCGLCGCKLNCWQEEQCMEINGGYYHKKCLVNLASACTVFANEDYNIFYIQNNRLLIDDKYTGKSICISYEYIQSAINKIEKINNEK